MIELAQTKQLLCVALEAIEYGLTFPPNRMPVDVSDYAEPLRVPAATFVTLHVDETLRGCIGRLEANRCLVEDVANNAHSAAFEDERFESITEIDLGHLKISISIVSPSTAIEAPSPERLIQVVQPGVDGLILEEGSRRSTLLPSVWEAIPDKEAFIACLKRKAGLPEDYWSPTLQFRRYQTQCFSN